MQKTAAPLLTKSDLPNIKHPDAWAKFQKKYPKGFFGINGPIVNKSQNRIVISLNFYCGGLCGWGKTEIYEKTTKGWKLMKTIDEWIS